MHNTNSTSFSRLTTKRLILQKETKEDSNQILFSLYRNKINRIPKIQNIYWNIILKSNLKLVGTICLWNFSNNQKIAEVGYDLNSTFQGKGIMSEALECVIRFGFEKLGLEKIEAYTHRSNDASKKLLLKNNFTLIADSRVNANRFNLIFEIKNVR